MRINFHGEFDSQNQCDLRNFREKYHYMNQQISLANFIKRRFERFYQLSRQFSDETNRICQ